MTDFETDGLRMAIHAFTNGDLDAAQSMIETSPSLFAQNARAQMLGSIYSRRGDIERAHEIWEAALLIDNGDPIHRANTWANMTGSYLAQGDAEQAIQAATRALDFKHDHIAALHNRALAYQAINEFAKALDDLNMVVAEHPEQADAWLVKGICELRLNDAEAARISVENSLELNPLNPTSHAQLGATYEALGDNLMANDSYRRAFELSAGLPGYTGLEQAIKRTSQANESSQANE